MDHKPSPILIVEDESDIRELIALHIKRMGFDVEEAANAEEGLKLIQSKAYQLLVLDWMLPGMSGVDLAKLVRQSPTGSSLPILMVTARAEPNDIVSGLEAGADDYITKPFDPAVLNARVQALIRRARPAAQPTSPIPPSGNALTLGQIRIDQESHQCFLHGNEVHLTPSEFKLMVALLSNKGRVLTRNRLIQLVQGDGITVVDRVVDTLVFGLRKKLGDQADLIETVRGVGYRVQGDTQQ